VQEQHAEAGAVAERRGFFELCCGGERDALGRRIITHLKGLAAEIGMLERLADDAGGTLGTNGPGACCPLRLKGTCRGKSATGGGKPKQSVCHGNLPNGYGRTVHPNRPVAKPSASPASGPCRQPPPRGTS
jgi:hypothetical protein